MAFQTGTVNHSIELLDTFRVFLVAQGWVIDSTQDITEGKLLHISKDNHFMHFRAVNEPPSNAFYRYQANSIAMVMSDAADTTTEFQKLNLNTKQIPIIDTIQKGPFRYWLFHLENPLVVFCILEYEADRFEFLMFGSILKYSDWVGGQFFGASWTIGQRHQRIMNTGPFQDNGSPRDGTTFLHAEVGGFKWLTCGNYSDDDYRLVRGMNFWHRELMDQSPSSFNGLSTMIPVQLFAERDDHFFSPIGELEHMRYVNILPYSPGQIIQLGADQWMIFPFHHKGPKEHPDYDGTQHLGYAVRVIQ
jgi:hypothetical protein